MEHLFTPQGHAAMSALLLARPLLAFDFDGTLAPIVSRPEQARISRQVAARLRALSSYLPIAIITGRSVADVRQRLGFEPQFIVGNHGAEDGENPLRQSVLAEMLEPVRARLSLAGNALAGAGIQVEDKGQSIALHFRQSHQPLHAVALIAELFDSLDNLHVFPGKMVVNIVPAQAPNKADALQSLVAKSAATHAFFAGDDVNDEPVFARAPNNWLTLRIGPAESKSLAMYYIDSPSEMAVLLEQMLNQLNS